jgi:hypothetical protein
VQTNKAVDHPIRWIKCVKTRTRKKLPEWLPWKQNSMPSKPRPEVVLLLVLLLRGAVLLMSFVPQQPVGCEGVMKRQQQSRNNTQQHQLQQH